MRFQGGGKTHELLGLGALLTRAWKAESLSLIAVSASFLNAFTYRRNRLQSASPTPTSLGDYYISETLQNSPLSVGLCLIQAGQCVRLTPD